MKAIRRLALRDLRFNKVRAILATILISLPVMAGLVIGSLYSNQSSHWMLEHFSEVEDLQASGLAACDCEIRQEPAGNGASYLDAGRENGDVEEMIAAVISPNNSVEIRQDSMSLMLQKSSDYNILHSEAQWAAANESLIIEGRVPESTDEIALSRGDQASLGVDVGDDMSRIINYDNPEPVTVVGITENVTLISQDGTGQRPTLDDLAVSGWGMPQLAITGPDPVTWEQVKELNRLGIVVESKHVLDNPPPQEDVDAWTDGGFGPTSPEINYIALATIGLIGLIEVVLLISPPFTMAVRRNERSLGQLAALGATAKQLRRLMLFQGAFLGFAGAVLGIIGYLVFRFALNSNAGEQLFLVAWHYPVAIVLAVILGLLAAVIPAVTASRINVVAVLTGRESGKSVRYRRSIIGPAILLLGIVLLFGAIAVKDSDVLYAISTIGIVLGLIGTAPICIRLASALVGKMSLPGKLAGRESVRSVHRTAPGVAAVMIVAVVAVFTISQFFTMLNRNFSEENIAGPRGAAWVALQDWGTGGDDLAILENSIRELDEERAVKSWTPVYAATGWNSNVEVQIPEDRMCPLEDWQTMEGLSSEEYEQVQEDAQTDPRCINYLGGNRMNPALPNLFHSGFPIVDDGTILDLLPGDVDVELGQATLDKGGVLLAYADGIVGGSATFTVVTYENVDVIEGETITVPTEAVLDEDGPYQIFSWEAAEELGLIVNPIGALIVFEKPVTMLETSSMLYDFAGNNAIFYETINEVNTDYVIAALAAAIISILVAVGTAIIIVVLAGRETRADYDTIDALGGKPRLRRQVSHATGLIIGLAGIIPGFIVGSILTIAIGQLLDNQPLEVPFLPIIGLAILIIALATIIPGLFAPRKKALTRRLD